MHFFFGGKVKFEEFYAESRTKVQHLEPKTFTFHVTLLFFAYLYKELLTLKKLRRKHFYSFYRILELPAPYAKISSTTHVQLLQWLHGKKH